MLHSELPSSLDPTLHDDVLNVQLYALFAADESPDDHVWSHNHHHDWKSLGRRRVSWTLRAG